MLPGSIVSVPTAVPVFVGYTQMAQAGTQNLLNVPFMIDNIVEYQQYFGGAFPETGLEASVDDTQNTPVTTVILNEQTRSPYLMFYSVQLYFANGGSPCYILSVGPYNVQNGINIGDFKPGDEFCPVLEQYNDITLVVIPDAISLPHTDTGTPPGPDTGGTPYYELQSLAVNHCIKMANRMAVMDVYPIHGFSPLNSVKALRNSDTLNKNVGLNINGPIPENYKFAAAYFPRLSTSITPSVMDPTTLADDDSKIKVTLKSDPQNPVKLDSLKAGKGQIYYSVKNYIANNLQMLLPAAPAVVGVYASVDNQSGVWTAPANWPISSVLGLEFQVSALDQGPINVDVAAGLSVNVIRSFPGRGPAIIWGARTLAGNDNEWRYISVRRFFFMVEQSVKNAIEPLVFASNDNNTWTRVKAMIGNYLTGLYKQGALTGNTAKDSFYVKVGLGETMVETDVWEGRMIVQIGMAVVRPAEFIILQFMQMMQTPG